MKAVIRLDVPEFQIGQEVSIYFKDTMQINGRVEPLSELDESFILNKIKQEEEIAIECENHLIDLASNEHINSYEEQFWLRAAENHRKMATYLSDFLRINKEEWCKNDKTKELS